MVRTWIVSALLVSVAGLSPAQSPERPAGSKEQVVQALESFAGAWEIVTVKPERDARGARRLVFRKDLTYAALDKDGKELWSGTFELDPTATPKIWDHRSHESQAEGGDVLGIYELNGDQLRVCCVLGVWKDKQWQGKPRPTSFDSKQGDVLMDLKRVEPHAER